jgi:competence protein ComEC
MSFAASAALCRAARRGGATARSGGEARVRDLLRTSAAALAATSPLVALHGGVVSPWALAANLVLIPWTGFVLLPAAIGATLVVAVARDDAPGPALALAAAERVAAGTIALLEGAAALLPELPAHRPRPAAWIAAVALAGVAIEARRALVQVGGALAVVALLALAPPAPIRPAPPRVVFLDVGLGDAVLVQGRRAAVLVDAGTALPDGPDLGAFEVVPALAALGVRRLDVVIVSHADLDHRGGVPSVLRAVPVGAVWIPRDASQDPALAPVLATARERGTPVREQGAGDAETRVGDVRVRPLWPPPACSGRLSRNDCSLVVRVEAGEGSVLLTGDLERDGETALLGRGGAALRADVLKLSHHGSASSSVDAFLVGVAGRVAVASAPWERRSPLPHPDVRVRAARAGYALWWTGRDGAVLVGLGGPIEVRPLREAGQTRNELE